MGLDLTKVEDTVKALGKEYQVTTVRTYVTAVVNLLNESPEDKPLADEYRKVLFALTRTIDSRYKEDPLTEGQKDSWQSWDDILAKRDQIGEELKKVAKRKKTLTIDDKVMIYQHLLLSLYTMIPPQRSEYSKCLILDKPLKEYPTTNNYYVLGDRDLIVLTSHKTVQKYGTRTLPVPPQLRSLVRESLELMPRKWLLSLVTNSQKPWDPTIVTKQLGLLLGKGAGVSLLRKVAKSTWRERNEGNDEVLAKAMGHSLEMANQCYDNNRVKKVDLRENSMFVFT
jgi:hypothetical protein